MHFQANLLLLSMSQLCIVERTLSTRTRTTRTLATRSVQERLPLTFGSAKMFRPLPGTVVGAHCKWEVKLNTVYNRIPQTITEIMCQNPNEVCGGNSAYHCRQIRSKMLVGYTEEGDVVNIRNNTVSIGCSCVRRTSSVVQQFLHPINEKRSARSWENAESPQNDLVQSPSPTTNEDDSLNPDYLRMIM